MTNVEYSVPLYFTKGYIDRLQKINNETKYAQITTVYNCVPAMFDASGFEQQRNVALEGVEEFQDFVNGVQYAKSCGFNFIYLMNSPVGLHPFEFFKRQGHINEFLEILLAAGIDTLRVANTQVIDYISVNYPEFKIMTSTSQEYYSIKQYRNLFDIFPKIKEVVPSYDLTRDITFLKNYRKAFSVPIELMVNEGCIAGCPYRYHHNILITRDKDYEAALMRDDPETFAVEDSRFSTFYNHTCRRLSHEKRWIQTLLANIIYPWEVPFYRDEVGITKYKIVGRNSEMDTVIDRIEIIVKGQEDYERIANEPFSYLNHYIEGHATFNSMRIKDMRPYLPSIQEIYELQKSGMSCHSDCGITCRYCHNKADALEKKFGIIE